MDLSPDIVTSSAARVATGAKRFGSGVGTGFGSEAEAVIRDVRIVADVFRSQGARSGAVVLRDGLRELGSSQTGVRDALTGTFVTPIMTDIKAGHPDQALGRVAFHAATMIFPGDKVLRAASAIVARSAQSPPPVR